MSHREQVAALAPHHHAAEIARQLGISRSRVAQLLDAMYINAKPWTPPKAPPRLRLVTRRVETAGGHAVLATGSYGATEGQLVSSHGAYYLWTESGMTEIPTAEARRALASLARKSKASAANARLGGRPSSIDWSQYPRGCGTAREVAERLGVTADWVRAVWRRK